MNHEFRWQPHLSHDVKQRRPGMACIHTLCRMCSEIRDATAALRYVQELLLSFAFLSAKTVIAAAVVNNHGIKQTEGGTRLPAGLTGCRDLQELCGFV